MRCLPRSRGVRSVPGTGELHAGPDDLFQAGPAPRRSAAGTAGAVHAGSPEGLRPVPRPVSGQLGTKPAGIYVMSAMAAAGVRQSRRAVPSRAGSAGVILRGWELITRPGCHQRPGQCEHCRSHSRSWTRPARGRGGQPDPGRLQPGGVRRRVLVSRGRLGRAVRPYRTGRHCAGI